MERDLTIMPFNFFNKKAVGLDISDESLEVLELEGSKENYKVVSTGRTEFEKGICERGRIKNKEKLAEIITNVLKKAQPQPIETKSIIFSLPEAQSFASIIQIGPEVVINNEFLENEVKKNIPIEASDLTYNYQTITTSDGQRDILLIGARTSVLKEWVSFFQELKIEISLFDIEMLASKRAINANGKLTAPFCVIDLGAATSNIMIFDEAGLRYSYAFNVAGDKITKSLEERKNINKEEAEKEKMDADLNLDNETANIIKENLKQVLNEVKSSIDFYKRKNNKDIKLIILIGGTSKLKGINDFFAKELNMEVKSPDISANSPETLYLEAFGAALRGLDWGNEPALKYQPPKETKEEKGEKLEKVSDRFTAIETQSENETAATPQISSSNPALEMLNKKKRIEIIILIIVIFLGVILISFAYMYRRNQESNALEIRRQTEELTKAIEGSGTFNKNIPPTPEITPENNINLNNATSAPEVKIAPENEEKMKDVYIIVKSETQGNVNVRQSPDLSGTIIQQVLPGEQLKLIEKKGDWYKVEIENGKTGWINKEFVEVIQ